MKITGRTSNLRVNVSWRSLKKEAKETSDSQKKPKKTRLREADKFSAQTERKEEEADQRERSMGNESSGNCDGNQMYQKDTRKRNGAERTLQNVELIERGRQD